MGTANGEYIVTNGNGYGAISQEIGRNARAFGEQNTVAPL
jgi:hypothetical protein